MRRTTIFLDSDTEVLLTLETLRSGKPAALLIREAIRAYLRALPGGLPPGGGSFKSGRKNTAEDAEHVVRRSKFGQD